VSVLPGASNLCGLLRHETASEGLKTLSGSPQRAVSLSLLHRIGLFRSLLSRGFGDGQSGTKRE
jgi:hypothetical protein